VAGGIWTYKPKDCDKTLGTSDCLQKKKMIFLTKRGRRGVRGRTEGSAWDFKAEIVTAAAEDGTYSFGDGEPKYDTIEHLQSSTAERSTA